MKAMRLAEATAASALFESDIPRAKPQQGEVLIRVHAAGVTPTEVLWYPTSHTKEGRERRGAVPSHEFSGEVAEAGEGVKEFTVGQEIYGMNDWFADGALAEYCVTRPDWIAPKPQRLSHTEAASLPIGALTAWQGLFDRAKIKPGERLLVHGGAGAVGVFVVQLAHSRDADVTATASAVNAEFVRGLGASRVLDYKTVRFENEVRDFDVVFDTVGGETLRHSWSVLKPSGRMVTIAAAGATDDDRSKAAFFIVEPGRSQLAQIEPLLDAGELRPVVDVVVPFSEAVNAFSGTVKRRGRGKLVVSVLN